VIRDNYIYGLVVSDTVIPGSGYSGAGIRLACQYDDPTAYAVTNCIIKDNIFVLPTVTILSGQSMCGIAVYGYSVGTTGYYQGYFDNLDGTFTVSPSKFSNIEISGNVVSNGTHGIMLAYQGTLANIYGNNVDGSSHRGIAVYHTNYCVVSSNLITEYGSSAVLLSENCRYCVVQGNDCKTTISGGEAGLNVQLACENNLITGNRVHGPTNYGVYMAIAVSLNTVSNNVLTGYVLAAIALESDIQDTNPANAAYSRPVYGAPPAGDYWAYANSSNNRIIGNVIGDPANTGADCGIYLSGTDGPTGTATVTNGSNTISGNVISTANLTHELYAYSETAGGVVNNVLKGNTFIGQAKFWMNAPAAQFVDVEGNSLLNYLCRSADMLSFTAADTTPSVAYGKYFMCVNTAPTSITNFDDGRIGQEIIVKIDVNTTIVHANDKIRLRGDANMTGDANDMICLRLISTIWYEQWRNS
jgi:hypothetical protein